MSVPALHLLSAHDQQHDANAGWLQWLVSRLDQGWRPREWDEALWLFTGDLESDRTAVWACTTPGCLTATHRHNGRCDSCKRERAEAGVSAEDFDAEPRRRRTRPIARGVCSVPGCAGELLCAGLCFRHERAWRRGTRPMEDFIAQASPLGRLDPCAVAGCGREAITPRSLCHFHDQRLRRAHRVSALSTAELADWVASEAPRLGTHQFSLAPLDELVRHELLYALQCRDKMPPPLDPVSVRILISRLIASTSMREADPEAICESGGGQYNSVIRGLFGDLARHLERAWVAYTGADPYLGDVWEVALLDLQPNGSRRWPATEGAIDFGVIELVWLREVAKDWARATRPYLQRVREALRACRAASEALVVAGRTDPMSLGAGDFALVVGAISTQRRSDGQLYSAAHRNLLLYMIREVLEHGRTNGLMTQVPDPFGRGRAQRVVEDPNEEQLGKALPESVIRQLDAHIGLLGPDGRSGSIAAVDLQAMHRTIYALLRDTGRRPGEVVSLKVGCIETIDGHPNLVYDNHKAARKRRRLPVTTETAAAVAAWERHRAELGDPPLTQGWLFPSPLLRARQSVGHLTASCVARAFKLWAARIPIIESELIGPDATPVPFARTLIVPYALRHSYAQRHADAGVPVDVLRELMDHRSVQTTMGYYSVSLHRKRQAIRSVGALALDADGNPAPLANPLAWERASVSVPFGNCTEPSNVKAGGGSCPIRFQCADCGFYRPDPSYLPAIEEHIASLRADRETAHAIGAADYVMASLTAQIDAFAKVAERVALRLADLGADERAEVEEASRLLRRTRALRRIPVVASTSHTG
jgi:integrase